MNGLTESLLNVNPRFYDRLNTVCAVLLCCGLGLMIVVSLQAAKSAKVDPISVRLKDPMAAAPATIAPEART